MRHSTCFLFALSLLTNAIILSPVHGQTLRLPEGISLEERTFLIEENNISSEIKQLRAQNRNASPEDLRDAMKAWHDTNASRLEAQRALSETIRVQREAQQPARNIVERAFVVPEGLSLQEATFLTDEHNIATEIRQLRKLHKDASPEELRDAMKSWHDTNAGRLGTQRALSDTIRAQKEAQQPLRSAVQRTFVLPEGLSPSEAAFLTEEHTIASEIRQLRALNKDASPEDLRDAMKSWHDINANRLEAQRALSETIRAQKEALQQQGLSVGEAIVN